MMPVILGIGIVWVRFRMDEIRKLMIRVGPSTTKKKQLDYRIRERRK
jgi:hypothetical protein